VIDFLVSLWAMAQEYRRTVTTSGGNTGMSAPVVHTGTAAYAGNQVVFAATQTALELLVENAEADLQIRLEDGVTWVTGDKPLQLGMHFIDMSHSGYRLQNRGAVATPISTITADTYTS